MTESKPNCDAVIVGAGIAGLRCALELQERGLKPLVLEASDRAGGRIRTDVVDGFPGFRAVSDFCGLGGPFPTFWWFCPFFGFPIFVSVSAEGGEEGCVRPHFKPGLSVDPKVRRILGCQEQKFWRHIHLYARRTFVWDNFWVSSSWSYLYRHIFDVRTRDICHGTR